MVFDRIWHNPLTQIWPAQALKKLLTAVVFHLAKLHVCGYYTIITHTYTHVLVTNTVIWTYD